ncbi:MAG TPA: MbcA/ParS/Xre antitoxin family protein [Steroidobacteraceae bacterium]|nr:MbcA/ParS/Xre antitoxin family protein [Steroidobacteraceae bacterium]
MRSSPQPQPSPDGAAVLSKAVVRAAEQLDLRQVQLARILGLSPATASRLTGGRWQLVPESKSWELALAFVRLYRSLAAITGGHAQAMRQWLHSGNAALGAEPVERILSAEGLVSVLQYLDAARGRL